MNSDKISIVEKCIIEFENLTGLRSPRYSVSETKLDGARLKIEIGYPHERFYKAANIIAEQSWFLNQDEISEVFITKKSPSKWMSSPELALLSKTLSETITVDEHTLGGDYLQVYIKSLTNAETQIVANGNHIVLGRRGSGKSSLLLFGKRTLESEKNHSIWISCQVYQKQSLVDIQSDIIMRIVEAINEASGGECQSLLLRAEEITNDFHLSKYKKLLLEIKRAIEKRSKVQKIFIFLDDFHVISTKYQAEILSDVYSFSRGTKCFLKISGIESAISTYDQSTNEGMQIGHDLQRIALDNNLTSLTNAMSHISNIFDAHCIYCGIPSFSTICNSGDVIARLIWVCAGVPRDAVNAVIQSIAFTKQSSSSLLTKASLNLACSETLVDKLKMIHIDAPEKSIELLALLEKIKNFAITQEKKNAFLVRIDEGNETYILIRKLIDLRLLHTLNRSITPNKAGETHIAVLLDYGFYVNMRKARSIDLFQENITSEPKYGDLRKLPVFRDTQEE